jgi:RNA polymerase II elongation factor ELL
MGSVEVEVRPKRGDEGSGPLVFIAKAPTEFLRECVRVASRQRRVARKLRTRHQPPSLEISLNLARGDGDGDGASLGGQSDDDALWSWVEGVLAEDSEGAPFSPGAGRRRAAEALKGGELRLADAFSFSDDGAAQAAATFEFKADPAGALCELYVAPAERGGRRWDLLGATTHEIRVVPHKRTDEELRLRRDEADAAAQPAHALGDSSRRRAALSRSNSGAPDPRAEAAALEKKTGLTASHMAAEAGGAIDAAASQSSESSSAGVAVPVRITTKELREHLIHVLARGKCTVEALAEDPRCRDNDPAYKKILPDVAELVGKVWVLKTECFREVRVDTWPDYSEDEDARDEVCRFASARSAAPLLETTAPRGEEGRKRKRMVIHPKDGRGGTGAKVIRLDGQSARTGYAELHGEYTDVRRQLQALRQEFQKMRAEVDARTTDHSADISDIEALNARIDERVDATADARARMARRYATLERELGAIRAELGSKEGSSS